MELPKYLAQIASLLKLLKLFIYQKQWDDNQDPICYAARDLSKIASRSKGRLTYQLKNLTRIRSFLPIALF